AVPLDWPRDARGRPAGGGAARRERARMGGDATTGADSLPRVPRIRVCWSEQLPAAMQVMLVSEPPRLLINASWWRRAARPERRQALETLRYGPDAARSSFQI